MSKIIREVNSLVEEYIKKKQALTKKLQNEFPSLIMPIIEKYNEYANMVKIFPEIEKISWTQYTPYFNDGDTCIFHRNIEIRLNGNDLYDLDEDIFCSEYRRNGRKINKLEEAVEEIDDCLDKIPEEFYLEMFGDHCEVEITKDGEINVNEYEHD